MSLTLKRQVWRVGLASPFVVIRICVRDRKPDLAVDRWTVMGTLRCLPGSAGTEMGRVGLVLVVVNALQVGPVFLALTEHRRNQ